MILSEVYGSILLISTKKTHISPREIGGFSFLPQEFSYKTPNKFMADIMADLSLETGAFRQ
jgi:hypothetical protein